MKIRYGFVSNSSSASYIVVINDLKMKDFLHIASEAFSMELHGIERYLLEKIRDTEESLQKQDEKNDYFYNSIKSSLLKLKKYLELVKKTKSVQSKIKIYLDMNRFHYTKKNKDLILTSSTTIHNDYNSGINDKFKELLLYLMFETDYKITCTIENDN